MKGTRTPICFDVFTSGKNPTIDRVTAIGIKTPFEEKIITHSCEFDLLQKFWEHLNEAHKYFLIGFNCASFDIPFLKIRSMKYKIKVPKLRGKVIDLRNELNNQNPWMRGKLREYAKMLGYQENNNGFTASHIPLLWQGNEIPELKERLNQDARMTWHLYEHAKEADLL